jgi:Galactosyltransferase
MKQKFFLHPFVWILMSLLMLMSFVILQLSVEKIVVLGNLSDGDFDWLRHSNYLSSFVRHENETEILLPKHINALRQRDKIACFVMSAPGNRLARSAIRRTWGKVIKPLFVLGLSDNETMRFVVNEATVFGDIIVEDFVDSYMNLTLKTAFAMKHFLKHFSDSKYFFKIDDDVLLNPRNLFTFLNDKSVPRNAILGRKGLSVYPHRDRENKWYIPYWLYGNDSFPNYIDGPAYLIPGMSVKNMPQYLLFLISNIPSVCIYPSHILIKYYFLPPGVYKQVIWSRNFISHPLNFPFSHLRMFSSPESLGTKH